MRVSEKVGRHPLAPRLVDFVAVRGLLHLKGSNHPASKGDERGQSEKNEADDAVGSLAAGEVESKRQQHHQGE